MASNTPPKIEVENCDENNTDKIEVLPSPTDDQNHDSALIGVSNDSTDAQASTSGRASPKLTLAIERPQPARTARHMEVIRIEERHGVFYNAIPALPLVPAAVFCVLNVVAPGVGTIMTVSTKIFVGNIPETCRVGDLKTLFSEYGNVVECDIVKNYGFVHFDNEQEAKVAVANLHNHLFHGNNIRVELSTSKVRQQPGMGGKGDCYRCGKEGHWSKDCPRGSAGGGGGGRGRGRGERGRGRGGGRGGMSDRDRDSHRGPIRGGDPYADPYGDPYDDPYYRYPPRDRYAPYDHPYERRRLPPPPPRADYYRDPYSRPPPEYYGRRPDPYYDSYYDRRTTTLPESRGAARDPYPY